MERSSTIIVAGGTALLLAAAASPPATAQQTAPAAPATPAARARPTERTVSHGLEEIVVTAQRVARNLQKTPVAVTSLNANALRERGVTSILDLNALAPNVSIGTRGGTGAAAGAVTIRGIGIDANPPASPSVGIYIDDVYFPGSYGNLLGLFDVGRIEVLRGPQGTLFGRNTIAGAIQYVSVKPKLDEYGGFLESTAGNLHRGDVTAGVNIPIGKIAALRLSGGITNRDGYVHDQLNEVDRGAERVKQGRAILRVEPTPKLSLLFKAEYVGERSNGGATIPAGYNYNTQLGRPLGPHGLDRFIAQDFYNIAGFNAPAYAQTQFRIGQAQISYRFSDQLTLKSISAYSSNTSRLLVDQDLSPAPVISVSRGDVTDQLFTQEFQLVGLSFANRLHWTLGAYYYNDRSSTLDSIAVIYGSASNSFGNYTDLTRSLAAYGQVTYDITRKLSIVGGLRYTSEKVSAADTLLPNTGSRIFGDTSPMVGLNYQVTPDILVYFKDSRGFRAGGYSPNGGGLFYYGPENATTYELGSRMQFLNKRLRINPTIFQTDWNSIQFNSIAFVNGIPFPFPIIENAGDALIKGAEVEVQAAVTRNLLLSASGSLLDAEYTLIGASQAQHLTLGSELKRSPKTAFTLGGRYEIPLGGARSMAVSLNYAWQAHQRSATTDQDNVNIPAYGLLNARIEFRPAGERFTLALFATNLTGQKYLLGGTNFGNSGVIPVNSWDIGPPRQYGVTARVNF